MLVTAADMRSGSLYAAIWRSTMSCNDVQGSAASSFSPQPTCAHALTFSQDLLCKGLASPFCCF